MNKKIKAILSLILLTGFSISSSKSLSQLEERAIGEFLYRTSESRPHDLIPLENYVLYELNRVLLTDNLQLDYPITLRIIDTPILNAFASSGSFIFIHTGIMKQMPDVSEIMGVLCHEITHVKEHHIRRRFEANDEKNNQKMLILASLPLIVLLPGIGQLFYSMALDQTFLEQQQFNQKMEYEADAGAVELMSKAGFDSTKLISAFETLGRYSDIDYIPTHFTYYHTHPLTNDRINRINYLLKNTKTTTGPELIRAQFDYNLLLSRIYSPYEKMPYSENEFFELIDTYKQAKENKNIESLLIKYPQSIMLRIDRLDEILSLKEWSNAQKFILKYKNDHLWMNLPFIKNAECMIDYETKTDKEFIRKYQPSLLQHQQPIDIYKLLAQKYQKVGNEQFYHLTQAKYLLDSGYYQDALNQLKHPSVDMSTIYAESIQHMADQMILINKKLS